jgi:hypothetical protein
LVLPSTAVAVMVKGPPVTVGVQLPPVQALPPPLALQVTVA